jgi:NAD(P)-dependent dehydrogenase (short-subunit alcohol dehydrogenase family)
VLGRNGPHPLDLFEKTIKVNLVGTFNVIRLAAAVISQNQPAGQRRARRDRQHRVDRRVRWTDRTAAYAASKGGIVGMTLADRARVRVSWHPRRHDCAGHLRHAAARRIA